MGFANFSKRRKIAVIFFIILCVLAAAFMFISATGGAGWGNIGVWFPLVYFTVLLSITCLLDILKKIFKKLYKPLIIIFYSGMIAFVIVFMIFCVWVLGYDSDNIPENPDLVIVLGCQAFGYEPGIMLGHRLETALETLNKYPGVLCIVSGGQGPNETVPEAVVMKKYLADRNIDENRIYEEAGSSSSYENLIFSKDIIEKNNLKYENIIIITSDYHIPRALLIARRIYHDSNIYAVKAHTPPDMFGAGIMREFFGLIKSYIFDS